MFKKLMNSAQLLITAVLVLQLMGCGTIMYPERKGQKSGRIDAGVAILDGIGLLFFLIPGIIAYAVDFNNGTIYLPGTAKSSLEPNTIRQVKFDPKQTSIAGIEKIITEETGQEIKLCQNNTKISEMASSDEMMARFAEVLLGIRDTRITLLDQ